MKKETKIWFNQAEDDFNNMLLLWKHNRYSGCVFFAQQAVEKILKAYFSEYNNKLPRKTHYIEQLIKDVAVDIAEIKISIKTVEELSKAYIRVRYPDLDNQYYSTKTKVEPLITTAQVVYIWIKKKLNSR